MLDFLFKAAYSIMRYTLGGLILIGLLFLGGLLLFWLFDFSSVDFWVPILLAVALVFPFILVAYILKKDNRQN